MRVVVALALAVAAIAPGRQEPTTPAGTARIVAAWREALELDLPAEVLGPGPAAVAPNGSLAAEGEAVALVARALFDAGREAESAALLAAAKPRPGTDVHVELERVRQALERDELEAVVSALSGPGETPRSRWPEVSRSWLLLGRALVRQGQWQQAVPCLERHVELEPLGEGAYSALHMLSQAALRRGDGAAAQELVQHAQVAGQWRAYWRVRRLQVRENPDEPLPRLGLAQLLLQASETERALAELEELTRRCPDFAQGWFHLAEVSRAMQRWEAARKAYDTALELAPDLSLARYNRAMLLLRAGEGAAARTDLERLVEGPRSNDPRLREAHLALARLLVASDEREAARLRYARYRELGGTEPLEP